MKRVHRDRFVTGSYYHIYNKVVSEATLFKSDSDYQDFLIRYIKYFSPYFDTVAYCLIPNHFHFLVRVKMDCDQSIRIERTIAAAKYIRHEESLNYFIEHQLSRMFSGVSLRHNKKYDRVGPLFKEGTKRIALRSESRLLYQLSYIHHNPIHHGLVPDFSDWKYSSYKAYISKSPTQIIKNEILE